MQLLDLDSRTEYVWAPGAIPSGSNYPVSRIGFCLVYSDFLEGVLVFGGIAVNRLNDLYLFKPAENRWVEIQPSGKIPVERAFASCFIQHNRFFVFGGLGEKDRSLNDLHILLLDVMQWQQVFTSPIPEPRHLTALTSTVSPKPIYFQDEPVAEEPNKQKVIRRSSQKRLMQSKILPKSEAGFIARKSVFGSQFTALPKIQTGVAPDDQGRVYLFGGMSMPGDVVLNDLWALTNPDSGICEPGSGGLLGFQWARIATSGEVR